jgi:general L-amino acid transport system permease protein
VEGRRRDVRAAASLTSAVTNLSVSLGSAFSWGDPRLRALAWQTAVVAIVLAIVTVIAVETASNLRARGIASGFGFLDRAAGFEIAQGPIEFSSRDTYTRALLVGLLNTLRISLLGIVLATTLGVALGVARLSNVWILSTIARGYLEVIRNTPLLLQLLFWYSLWQALPGPRDALNPLPGVFLCFRGLFFPSLSVHAGGSFLSIERPAVVGFGFQGGASVSPEFAALLVGLTIYTAAFIGEIVRGGVLAVDKGQSEAAAALGLSRLETLRFVVFPQALRLIIPPTTSQFLNLLKNSSLAVAIGYPDLISIANTMLNQTGQAIETIALAMAAYLAVNAGVSLAMNTYNAAILRRGGGPA